MASHCESTAFENKVCCPSDDSKRCYVHWGGAGEMISHVVFEKMAQRMKSFCYAEEDGESFAPEGMGTVLFTKRRLSEALPFFQPPGGKGVDSAGPRSVKTKAGECHGALGP